MQAKRVKTYYNVIKRIITVRKKGTPGDPPPFFDLKLVYSYVIEVADSESDLGLHGKPLVSEKMVFLRIRVTCIFQLNDLFALLFEKMHLLIYTLKVNTYIHPQSKYLHTPSK